MSAENVKDGLENKYIAAPGGFHQGPFLRTWQLPNHVIRSAKSAKCLKKVEEWLVTMVLRDE